MHEKPTKGDHVYVANVDIGRPFSQPMTAIDTNKNITIIMID